MRLIVRCQDCLRQFDASGHPGERMHCACGAALVVATPRGHDAAVVRCSACGGARSDDDRSCAHCGAALSLHERDLHTVCPGCLARISDRAQFCHGCGLRIVPESLGSAPTAWPCPACGDGVMLSSRRFDDVVGGAECARCAGLFVGHEVFAHLEKRAREDQPAVIDAAAARPAAGSLPPAQAQAGPLYRPCPVCRKLMNRQNYARSSGVIVDRCHQHGVWFDDDELERALRFVRQGGARRAAARDAEAARHRERVRRLDRRSGSPEVFGPPIEPSFGIFDILDGLASLFRRR